MLIRIEKENQMRHLLNPLDFSVEEIDQLLDLASDIEANPAKYAIRLRRKENRDSVFMSQAPVHA